MTLIKVVLMLYSFIVDQRAACHTVSNTFLKSTKNMEEVLLVLKVPFTQYSQVENLFSCTASWSKPCLFLSYDCFCLRLQPV